MTVTTHGRLAAAGALAASLGLALAACGSSSGSGSGSGSGGAGTTPPAATGNVVHVVNDRTLGSIIVDAKGFTLYRFDMDTAKPSASNCTGGCATAWPPSVAPAAGSAAKGIDGKLVGSITRPDGSRQLTVNGWPMYRYATDAKPGDIQGQGVNGTWFAVTPTGGKAMAMTSTMTPAPSAPTYGSGGSNGY